MTLESNICTFSESNPFVAFAKASKLMHCKIQTMCVNTNISVTFTPPEAIDEDYVKILYYCRDNFTICQRVVKIRMNKESKDLSKPIEPDFSKICIQQKGIGNYASRDDHVVYEYDCSLDVYEVKIHSSLSVLQKFERFFEKIPHDSSVGFIFIQRSSPFVHFFVTAILRYLGRKPPIDAKYDPDIVQTWLSDNEARRDLITHPSTLDNMNLEYIINLSSYLPAKGTKNPASKYYTQIRLPTPSTDEHEAMTFISSEKNKQTDEAYQMNMHNFEKYLGRMYVSKD